MATVDTNNSTRTSALVNNTTTVDGTSTERGTKIVKSSGQLDKNSFLTILCAQLRNLDPTQDQDSTQYISQMAQFSALEQMTNLNDTMTDFAHQSLVGKGVTVDVADSDGVAYTGIVRGLSKDSTGTYLSVEVNENGENKYIVVDVNKVTSVINVQDYTNSNMLLNSNFLAASELANSTNNKVLVSDTDSNGNETKVSGTVTSAFIDSGEVKIRVTTSDGDEKVYPYTSIIKAGDLTSSDMDTTTASSSTTTASSAANTTASDTTNSNTKNISTAKNHLQNINDEIKTLNSIIGN